MKRFTDKYRNRECWSTSGLVHTVHGAFKSVASQTGRELDLWELSMKRRHLGWSPKTMPEIKKQKLGMRTLQGRDRLCARTLDRAGWSVESRVRCGSLAGHNSEGRKDRRGASDEIRRAWGRARSLTSFRTH